MSKSKIFFWSVAAFIGGVALASFVRLPFWLLGLFFIFGSALTLFGAVRFSDSKHIVLSGCLFLAALVGAFRFGYGELSAQAADIPVGETLRLRGVIVDEPVRAPQSQRLVFKDDNSRARVLITTRPYPQYGYGDIIEAVGRVERPENFSDDFDYTAYLAKDGIFYTIYFPRIEIVGHNGASRLTQNILKLKSAFSERLMRAIPEPHSSFMAGLILGERKSLPQSLSDELRITGTTHLVAVSGYNITIIADALLKTLMFFFIPFSWAFGLAVIGIMLFTILTGAAASVVRAAVMGILVLVARREGRQYRIRNALTFAAGLMIFYNPAILRFDIGFQLSFLAALGLVYGAPIVERACELAKFRLLRLASRVFNIRIRRASPNDPRPRSLIREAFVSTLAAQLFVLPLLVWKFGQLSLISPLANVAVVPFIPATMFLGFLTGGLGFVSDILGRAAAGAGWIFLNYELGAIRFFSQIPYAALAVRGFGVIIVLGIYIVIGIVFWRRRINSKFLSNVEH